jgi:hypothetical protein
LLVVIEEDRSTKDVFGRMAVPTRRPSRIIYNAHCPDSSDGHKVLKLWRGRQGSNL